MPENMHIRLTGHLITREPIHIVPPGAREVVLGDGKALENAHEVIYQNGQRIRVPAIPASTMRGGLRRAATALALQFGDENAPKVGLSDYLYNAIGGAKGKEKDDLETVGKRATRRLENPLIALFGAAKPWDTSRALVTSAWADPEINGDKQVTAVMIGGRRTDDMVQNQGLAALLDPSALIEWKEEREVKKGDIKLQAEIKKLEKQLTGANDEERRALNVKISEVKAGTSDKNSVLRPLHHMVIPRGVALRQNIHLASINADEFGLFLSAIDQFWFATPQIGGKIAHGYGLVSAEWKVERLVGRKWEELGTLKAEPYVGIEGTAFDSWRDDFAKNLAAGAYRFTGDEQDQDEDEDAA